MGTLSALDWGAEDEEVEEEVVPADHNMARWKYAGSSGEDAVLVLLVGLVLLRLVFQGPAQNFSNALSSSCCSSLLILSKCRPNTFAVTLGSIASIRM